MDGEEAIDPVVLDALREASLMKTLRIDDIEGLPVLGTLMWQPVRRPLGITAFGINAYTAGKAGDEVVEEHTEQTHEEAYIVIRGHATFTVDGEEIDAPWGTIVFLDDPNQRRARGRDGGRDDGARGRRRARARTRSRPGSTSSRRCRRAMPATGTRRGRSSRRRSPSADIPAIRYHLACVEARAGNADRALDELRIAVRGAARLRPLAGQEDDLASLRDDPRFPR